MSHYSALIANKIGMPDSKCDDLLYTSAMHDVGKIGIPDHILLKPASLTDNEWQIMKTHAYIGYKILSRINTDMMKTAAEIAYSHHEKWDGSGYPRGLKGGDIPIVGRICAIADVFDALTSKRVYKPEFPLEKAINIMKEGRGKHFDPELLDIFLNSIDDVMEIKNKYQETKEDFEKQEELVKLYKNNIQE
jgi:putative two-component system response regulator